MCGVLGAFCFNGFKVQRERFIDALTSLEHRGPDDWSFSSFERDERANLRVKEYTRHEEHPVNASGFIGHRRLAIIDLSDAGVQPMWTLDGHIGIVFNGEIYNYIELKDELSSLGYKFSTATDTEVILFAYREWGVSCFERFNGMWGIVLVDLHKQEVVLSRDRFGVKPLYYYKTDKNLLFGSEIKGLLKTKLVEPIANQYAIHEFLTFNQHPREKETFFEGIKKVASGSFMRFDIKEGLLLEEKRWWEVRPEIIREDLQLETWKEVFLNSLSLRMRSDVPVGACLSGGLDSSAIVTSIKTLFPENREFHTFTSCYRDRKFDERKYAELVVQHVGANAHWIYPSEECSLIDDLSSLVRTQESPFSTLSIYSQYCVMRLAKEAGVKVLLDGQGADELLLGYDNSIAVQNALYLKSLEFRRLVSSIVNLRRQRPELSTQRLLALIFYTAFPSLSNFKNYRKIRPLLGSAYDVDTGNVSSSRSFPSSLESARKRWLEDHPLPTLLRYEDYNSMAFSIETRLPFLDYRLVNLAFGLAENMISHNGWTKYAVRSAMDSIAPKEVTWRKSKLGFPTPTNSFLFENKEYFGALFSDEPRSNGLINCEQLAKIFKFGNIESFHWRFVSTELWMREFNVSI